VSDNSLNGALEAWLEQGGATLLPVFPPPLETSFAADLAPSKLRALRLCTVLGIAAGLAIAPPLWILLADARWVILVAWLGVAVPAGVVCHLLLWTRLSTRLQELQTAFVGVVVAICFCLVMTATAADVETCLFGGLMLLLLLDVIGGGFEVPLGAAFAAILLLLFTIGTQFMPGAAGLHGAINAGLFAVCAVFAVFGAWRLETQTRRNWALMLRERLARRELADSNSELTELAQRDPLTGLANRRAYETCERASWRRAEEKSVAVGLIVVDIDHFKLYNDFYGHPAGDACLQTVARTLGEQLRGAEDLVARVGGEEFAILLPDLSVETAGDIAERVRQAVADLELPHLGCGPGKIVTISCGACSLVPRAGACPKDLFAAADAALYAAKQTGRNRVCLAEQNATGGIPRGRVQDAEMLDQG
jgi:diguanylate cyclase (GGDEF)-like protein